jgi:hypothetical protein
MPSDSANRRYNGDRGLDPERPFYYQATPAILTDLPPEGREEPPPPKMPGWQALRTHLEARLAAEKIWRLNWWRNCGEIARFALPRRYHAFLTENNYNRGLRQDGAILNNTATLDGETCAGGIMSVCTDPDSDWLQLGPGIPNLELDKAGQSFYEDLTERLRFIQDETNFYESMSQSYEDGVFFGTGVAIDYEDASDIFVGRNPCFGEYCLASAANGSTQALYVEERRTVEQIVTMFGYDNCSEAIRNAWNLKGGALEQEFVVGCAIEPNFAVGGDDEPGQLPGYFTWREVYWLVGKSTDAPLSIAGFHEKPWSAWQWHRVSNDPYGRGPGWTGLGDTIELQIKAARQAELVEKIVRPPMAAPVSLKNEPHSIKPDQITYYDATTGKPQFTPVFMPDPQALGAITASIQDTQERLHRTYHADLFRLIEEVSLNTKRDVSATEIDALREERLMQLGPVIGRVYRYGIRPRIKRQLAIMYRRGLWPKVPQSLQRVPLQIDFISMLTRARRSSSIVSITRVFQFQQSISAEFAASQDVLDADEAVREVQNLGGASSKIIRAPAEVRKLRAQRQQQMAAQQQAQVAMAAVQGAKTLSDTNLGSNNALRAALTGASAG